MASRGRILRATPGRVNPRSGKFTALKGRARKARNIMAGFHDEEGVFHPIRASSDYDPGRAGEGSRKGKKRKPAAAKKKAAPKKRAKARPAAKRAKPKKRPAAKKARRR